MRGSSQLSSGSSQLSSARALLCMSTLKIIQLLSLLSVIDDRKYVIILRKAENEGTILNCNIYVTAGLGGTHHTNTYAMTIS